MIDLLMTSQNHAYNPLYKSNFINVIPYFSIFVTNKDTIGNFSISK